MKVQVLDVSSYEREVEVELPPDVVRDAFDDALKDIRKKARVPGFRKGKVPRSVLLKRFRPHLEGTVGESLVEDSLGDALARRGLIPVSQPIMQRGDLIEGQPFRYTLRFEVMPKVDLKDYTGLAISDFPEEVTDEQLTEALDKKRHLAAEFQAVDDRPTRDTDVVTYSYAGTIDGEPLPDSSREGLTATLGSGEAPEPFEKALLGRRPGEEFELDVELPEDYPEPSQVGKQLVATVKVTEVQERLVPELDDEFAKDQDFDDLEAMRTSLRDELNERQGKEARRQREKAVVTAVLENNEFDIPPSLVRGRTDAHLQETMDTFSRAGLDLTQLRSPDELRAKVREEVVYETRRQVVIDAVARQERIEIGDADVDAKMEEIAENTDTPLPKVRATYAQGEGRAQLEHVLRAERVLDFLLAQTTIAEESSD